MSAVGGYSPQQVETWIGKGACGCSFVQGARRLLWWWKKVMVCPNCQLAGATLREVDVRRSPPVTLKESGWLPFSLHIQGCSFLNNIRRCVFR